MKMTYMRPFTPGALHLIPYKEGYLIFSIDRPPRCSRHGIINALMDEMLWDADRARAVIYVWGDLQQLPLRRFGFTKTFNHLWYRKPR